MTQQVNSPPAATSPHTSIHTHIQLISIKILGDKEGVGGRSMWSENYVNIHASTHVRNSHKTSA